MVVTKIIKHRRTDPACTHFRGYPTNRLTRWWFDRGRGKACVPCLTERSRTLTCTAVHPLISAGCTLPADHPGYHRSDLGGQWVGEPMKRDGSRSTGVVMRWTTTAEVPASSVQAFIDDGWVLAGPWQCECGWANVGNDSKCQRCFLQRPA